MLAKENGGSRRKGRVCLPVNRGSLGFCVSHTGRESAVKSKPLGPTWVCSEETWDRLRWLGSSSLSMRIRGKLASTLGVKMIYIIRLIKRLSAL